MNDQSLIGRAVGLHDVLTRVLNAGQHVVLLIVRAYYGFDCMRTGYGHLKNFHGMVDNFIGWNIPFPKVSVAVSGTTEMVGGAMLMVGLFSRLISIPLFFNFIVAIVSVSLSSPKFHDKILHFWNNPGVILDDTAFPFLCASGLVLFFGPGLFSVDAVLRRIFVPKKLPTLSPSGKIGTL